MIILCMLPANKRQHYNVTSSRSVWVHAQNDPWTCKLQFDDAEKNELKKSNWWKPGENLFVISSKNIVIHGNSHIILFLTCFSGAKTQKINEKPHLAMAAPLSFMVCQSVVVLWCHANIYCDIILSDCPPNVSKWARCIFPPSSSWLSLVNYQVRFTAFSQASM